jgi:hypothetical protein
LAVKRKLAHKVSFSLKTAAKLTHHNKHIHPINETMCEELNFICQALDEGMNIKFDTPIAFIMPREPSTAIFGDSSHMSCRSYSFELKFWLYLSFPTEFTLQTLLHLKNDKENLFISINVLEYVMIIINFCTALLAYQQNPSQDDLHPVVLCMIDNTSAKNWTSHTSKKSKIGNPCKILLQTAR